MGRRRAETSVRRSTTEKPSTRSKRAQRARPTPRWLTGRQDLDEIAQRRCLMVLSVLSGEKPVTTVVGELGISRGTYYQLETKALLAMLGALAPGAEAMGDPNEATPAARIVELEGKVSRLEQERRRLERLLYLTRKIVPVGPVRAPGKRRGRPPGSGRRSTIPGSRPSPSSPRSGKRTVTPETSIPTTDGETKP